MLVAAFRICIPSEVSQRRFRHAGENHRRVSRDEAFYAIKNSVFIFRRADIANTWDGSANGSRNWTEELQRRQWRIDAIERERIFGNRANITVRWCRNVESKIFFDEATISWAKGILSKRIICSTDYVRMWKYFLPSEYLFSPCMFENN